MRSFLDGLYDAAAWLAAVCMIGLLVMVLLGIAGRELNFYVPGTDAYAGYMMAGAGFLALAHALKRGEHIRVTLILARLTGNARHGMEVWALGVSSLLAILFAYFSVRHVWHSWIFKDISTSHDATALWIPQLAMAAGAVLFAVAVCDELVLEVRHRRSLKPSSEAQTEALHNE